MSFRMEWLDLLAVQETLKSPPQNHSSKASILLPSAFFIVQHSHTYMTTGKTISVTRQTFVGKLMSIMSVMPSNHVILCHCLLILPSIFPSIRVFSNESFLHIRWPKYWSFSFNISPDIQYWFPFGWTGWISLQSKGLSRVFSNTTVQKHQFFCPQLSL